MERITIKPCVNPITSTTGGCSNGAVTGLANGGYGLGAVIEISSFARVDNTKKGTGNVAGCTGSLACQTSIATIPVNWNGENYN